MLAEQVLEPSSWEHVQTLWVGAICSVDEVVLKATGQPAVLKHMHAEHRQDPSIAARCLNEGLILRHLQSGHAAPGIPRLFALGTLPNGCPALLLERLGHSLAERMQPPEGPAKGTQDGTELLLHVGVQVADALTRVHDLGVVHRDVRPDNILFAKHRSDGDPPHAHDTYLIDFGLAKVFRRDMYLPISTGDEDILGTDLYMAPEQWECAKYVTGAADIYSLGIVLYQMASGRVPFADERRQVLMYQHLVTPPGPLPIHVPRALSRLILSMLAKRSEDRPGAKECGDQLRALQ